MPVINSKPDMNIGIWAEGGNVENPSSEKIEEGWVVEKPLNEYMNWVQNRQDKMLQYLNQRGIPVWDSRTEYPIHAYVSREGTLYQALSQNSDRDPTLHQAIWKIAFVGYGEFVTYADDIQKVKSVDGFLKHYVRKVDPVMSGEVKAPAYSNPNKSAGLKFSGDVARVTRGNTVVAEFSGGTKPKDVVTHEQLAIAIQNYKVGDIYITTASGDPKNRLGYGTWQRFAQGKTLVGFTDSVSNNIPEWVKRAGSEFGEYEHKLTVEEMPTHTHDVAQRRGDIDLDNGGRDSGTQNGLGASLPTGGDKPHNNVQPSIVVYFWKRVT